MTTNTYRYQPNNSMSEKEEQQRLFERDLSNNIRQGNIDIVKCYVKSDLFKQNYKDRWIFKYFSSKCKRPRSRHIIHTHSPMIAAVASGSLDMVKLIAKTEPNVYIEEEMGSCALTLAIEKGKRDIFKYIATRYFTDYNHAEYCGKVLLLLLFAKWFEEFEFLKFVTGVDIYTFFHSHHRPLRWKLDKNFPLHSLCENGIHESISYLLENYDRDILNFDGESDMKIEPFFSETKPEIEYQYYSKPNSYDLRYPVTCTEQLLTLSMYYCSIGLYDTDMEIEDRNKTIKLILNSNHLSEKAIFNKDSDDTEHWQWQRPLLLECVSMCEDEDIYMKIEQLLINVMGKEEAYTYLLNHELSLFPKNYTWKKKEDKHRDSKRIDRFVKEGADCERMKILSENHLFKFRSFRSCKRQMIYYLVSDFDLAETVCWVYKEGNLSNIKMFACHAYRTTFLDIILDTYIDHYKKQDICEENLKNTAKAFLTLYAAGEDLSRQTKHINSRALAKLNKLNDFKDATYEICPYTGPLINDWTELLSDNWYEMYDIKCNTGLNIKDPVIFDAVRKAKIRYHPTLQEIARKQIRDTLKSKFKNSNLFPIINRLSIPTRFKNFLLFV